MSIFKAIKGLFLYEPLEREIISEDDDSQLIKKYCQMHTLSLYGQPLELRVLVAPHPKRHSMPKLPLVVFIHGLGGNLNQFDPLIEFFSYFSAMLALDLPGHGKSKPSSSKLVYSREFLVAIVEHFVREMLDTTLADSTTREVLLVGHSMGTIIASRLAAKLNSTSTNSTSTNSGASQPIKCLGVISICPPERLDPGLEKAQGRLDWTPAVLFNLFRAMDRQGGLHSASVNRMFSDTASDELRRRQLRWNLWVQTVPWMYTASQVSCLTDDEIRALATCNNVLFIGADQDKVCPVKGVKNLYKRLREMTDDKCGELIVLTDAGHSCIIERPHKISGLIGDFIKDHIDEKLSLSWQLAYIASKTDKWSLKNEAKWRAYPSVGEVIQGTRLRGIKTLRQDDHEHSPHLLEKNHPEIIAIIDISREEPPYDPSTFKHIKYHKFPTVSKVPPTREEVNKFIELVSKILDESPDDKTSIAVHCHYGFNRTGFFLCSYMIQHDHVPIEIAIERFKVSREPGIKHPHFVDELYVRYQH